MEPYRTYTVCVHEPCIEMEVYCQRKIPSSFAALDFSISIHFFLHGVVFEFL